MKRPRPYIPISVRLQVACRQLAERGRDYVTIGSAVTADGARLAIILETLFGDQRYELHHRPSLINRQWNARKREYNPPANDPAHLIYLAKHDHKIETLVRGVGAQRSDFAQRRYLKRVAQNRTKRKTKGPFAIAWARRSKAKQVSRPWPKHKMQSRPWAATKV